MGKRKRTVTKRLMRKATGRKYTQRFHVNIPAETPASPEPPPALTQTGTAREPAENPVAYSYLLEHPDPTIRKFAATHPTTPPHILTRFAGDANREVREEVARRAESRETFTALLDASEGDVGIATLVYTNPNLTRYRDLVDVPSLKTQLSVVKELNDSGGVGGYFYGYNALSLSGRATTRQAVAESKLLPEKVARRLLDDPACAMYAIVKIRDVDTLRDVAWGGTSQVKKVMLDECLLPKDVLQVLEHDEDPHVREAAGELLRDVWW